MILGLDPSRPADLVLINAPLRDYATARRINDYTLPVLGLAYIATYARSKGFNVGVLDAEALGLSIPQAARLVNDASPRWVGFNLLAPTYEHSVAILRRLHPHVHVMLGGHHAKAMPAVILSDGRIPRIDALILGEGETRVAALLEDEGLRTNLKFVSWRDPLQGIKHGDGTLCDEAYLAPPIDELPVVDRTFLVQDPFPASDGRVEANIVGSRGCPYNCSFCGAAISANPDVKIRTRDPALIADEMESLAQLYGVSAFRFVDDLFLAQRSFIRSCVAEFESRRFAERFVWDATGRINVLDRLSDEELSGLRAAGLREVALGIESGSDRVLRLMDKRITRDMALRVAERLLSHGIGVKGYFILGYPDEQPDDLDATVSAIEELWEIAAITPGAFRASVFEFRPYPGTPVWDELIVKGHAPAELLRYTAAEIDGLAPDAQRQRDEFNFTVAIQFGGVPLETMRTVLAQLANEQQRRLVA
jgi:anaerobic magnesium-protoporphyrin IX monomethyl ester cyclase